MIHLVTLNPALDLTLRLDKPASGKIGNVGEAGVEAGGKALNIARFMKRWGLKPVTWLGTGGESHPTHVLYRSLLAREGLSVRFLGGEAPVRFNVVLEEGRRSQKYNHPGHELDLKSFGRLYRTVQKDDYLVLTGRLPRGMNDALYASWIQSFNRKGVRTVVDTSGEPLREALKARPWYFKVNLHEFSGAWGEKFGHLGQIRRVWPQLIKSGLLHGAITNGAEGAVVWNGPELCQVIGPAKVKKGLVVGAGDAFLAGYLKGLTARKSFWDCAKLACAAGGVVASAGIRGFDPDLVNHTIKRVKVIR